MPYPLEVQAFVDYLKENKPNATIAVLKANDDFGQSYSETLKELIKGTNLKIVQTEQYDNTERRQSKTQVTSLAATKADAFVLGGDAAGVPDRAERGAATPAGSRSPTCRARACRRCCSALAGANANGVLSVTPLLDPADPANASNPAMQLYKAAGRRSTQPDADTDDGIVAYGWTTARACSRRRSSSSTEARPGRGDGGGAHAAERLRTSGSSSRPRSGRRRADDWFIGETFQIVKYDAAAGHTNAGRSAHRRRRQDRVAHARRR